MLAEVINELVCSRNAHILKELRPSIRAAKVGGDPKNSTPTVAVYGSIWCQKKGPPPR